LSGVREPVVSGGGWCEHSARARRVVWCEGLQRDCEAAEGVAPQMRGQAAAFPPIVRLTRGTVSSRKMGGKPALSQSARTRHRCCRVHVDEKIYERVAVKCAGQYAGGRASREAGGLTRRLCLGPVLFALERRVDVPSFYELCVGQVKLRPRGGGGAL
jgi:hypothetical protein